MSPLINSLYTRQTVIYRISQCILYGVCSSVAYMVQSNVIINDGNIISTAQFNSRWKSACTATVFLECSEKVYVSVEKLYMNGICPIPDECLKYVSWLRDDHLS